MTYLKLPVGIENFEEIRKEGYYYVDKTNLIRDLLQSPSKVTLFTRPRRFGKTLTMSMLKYFFELGADQSIFEGLAVTKEKELCDTYRGKYPVILLSLKDVEGQNYEIAYGMMKEILRAETRRLSFLEQSNALSERDKQAFAHLLSGELIEPEVHTGLKVLSELLYKHSGRKVILLIDEYDVPLDKAFQRGYYDQMVSLIRSMFSHALKTNDFLQFAVLTGCLRVSKESIFTGLNNIEVHSIVDSEDDEYFGFTAEEVNRLLKDYGRTSAISMMKEWYDGYRFGETDVYCPWDVINYTKKLLNKADAQPQAFWINTSGNDLVRRFVDKADRTTQAEIERLIEGEAIEKNIRLDLTYNELDNSIDNLWSVLFMTGYLTQKGKGAPDEYDLIIPNREVREVFILQIREWFKDTVIQDKKPMAQFCQTVREGDAQGLQTQLNTIMSKMISVLDTKF